MAATRPRALPPVMSCTNTKALLDHTTFPAWADALRAEATALSRAGFLVLLPGPLFDAAARAFAGTGIAWGAQDVWSDGAPPTGELPAEALAHAGCQAVMCGHHERRRRLGESDTDVAGKAAAAGQAMVPVVCVGEREEGPAGRAVTAVLDQAAPVLDALPADAPLVWLYEPAWTGGAGAPAPYPQIAEVAAALRERCAGRTAGDTRVLYGGAVTPGVLTRALEAGAALDGVGIGRAAHDPAQRAAVTAELLDLLASREQAAAPAPRKAPT
ncbi:triose-phosphate isomerase [Streptomyces koyangensis]|uniref:triose-phosphate isomerase n=1 Tax=Streptomyces koyangensis TaxID=188770 RepID=UPI00338217EB